MLKPTCGFPRISWMYSCQLDVRRIDPPSFNERQQNVESEMGDNITMNCLVDSNPKADIVWVFDPIDRVSWISVLSHFFTLFSLFSAHVKHIES